jgi:hypothetical protein
MTHDDSDRRRHSRFPLGLPVKVHLADRGEAVVMELVDLSGGGGCFRAPADTVCVDQRAAFGFVIAGDGFCVARGRVVRSHRNGLFAVKLDRTNRAFRLFLSDLETTSLR